MAFPCTAARSNTYASIPTGLYVIAETAAVWKLIVLPVLWNIPPNYLQKNFSLC